ncbi:uncharacterized protein BDW47DRAFT_113460 [Aspergillus candidus]|uniref:Secreted protein n=1 Tax=Aspergillus candidus TaxID=41067 RepID=A0A2I2EZE0_ASPCN|nr:hypothetical protein BDW47DRAFT_113460 [Aspergillus candidus]PLB33747.1 hypothetical protein BDW47DRAFT_113460 [Aspergillus candidus]
MRRLLSGLVGLFLAPARVPMTPRWYMWNRSRADPGMKNQQIHIISLRSSSSLGINCDTERGEAVNLDLLLTGFSCCRGHGVPDHRIRITSIAMSRQPPITNMA